LTVKEITIKSINNPITLKCYYKTLVPTHKPVQSKPNHTIKLHTTTKYTTVCHGDGKSNGYGDGDGSGDGDYICYGRGGGFGSGSGDGNGVGFGFGNGYGRARGVNNDSKKK
jgi:hypothetical protein